MRFFSGFFSFSGFPRLALLFLFSRGLIPTSPPLLPRNRKQPRRADTSSHTLAYTLALLAAHPRAAAKVEAELAAAGLLATEAEPRPRRLEFADLSRSALPYLNAALLESMRLLPVAAGGTARTAGKGGFELTVRDWERERGGGGGGGAESGEAALRTVRVPEGVDCWVPFYVLHRSRAVWGDDAEEFVPERFLDPAAPLAASAAGRGAAPGGAQGGGGGGAGAAEAAKRFLPFSLGARDCVGQALARTALVAELAALVGRFSFEVDRERMAGSLLPRRPAAAEGPLLSGRARGAAGEEAVVAGEGLGSTVLANEAMAVTLRVLGGVWLLARPRAQRGAVGGGGERES